MYRGIGEKILERVNSLWRRNDIGDPNHERIKHFLEIRKRVNLKLLPAFFVLKLLENKPREEKPINS